MEVTCNCGQCNNDLCVRKVPIFSSLSVEEIGKFVERINHRVYKKGELLMHEGEKSDTIVIMHEGSAKAYKYTTDGREQILYVFSEGDFFGEHDLLSDRTTTYSVEALETVRTCTLSKKEFQHLLYQYPDIAIKLIAELSNRMTRLENVLQGMGVRNVDNRIGSLLMEFAAKYGTKSDEGTLIKLPLSREGMANYLGIARETVSRKLSQMENDGIIRSISNKLLLILDSGTLVELAGTNLY